MLDLDKVFFTVGRGIAYRATPEVGTEEKVRFHAALSTFGAVCRSMRATVEPTMG